MPQNSITSSDTMSSNVVHQFTVEFNGKIYNLQIIKSVPKPITSFNGQKIAHPWYPCGDSDDKMNWQTNKRYDTNNPRYDDIDEVLHNTDRFDIKHDGSCGAVMWDGEKFIPYKRYDVRKDKKTGEWKTYNKNDSWIECEPKPIIDDATHWPHFIPVTKEDKPSKWYFKAFENKKITEVDTKTLNKGDMFTIEYMGKVLNGKISDMVDDVNLVFHGALQMDIPKPLRCHDGFKRIFETLPLMEGLICYTNKYGPIKIRCEMMGIDWGTAKVDKFDLRHGLSTFVV
uniref:Uncharacterized protein n=1 Tax=viral metagenome TaxID=1070528 RepID=A0A6C0AC51_9ZZZZ